MKRFFILLLWLCILTSCAALRYGPPAGTYHSGTDSTRVTSEKLDSIYRVLLDRDSTYKHDSIYVYVKGDTVTKYVERETYRYRILRDTLYRYKLLRDTTYIEKRDTVTIVPEPVVIEKPIKWYNQAFIWFGRLCCIAFILRVIFLYIKRKV